MNVHLGRFLEWVYMRVRFNKSAYDKMSKHSRILYWCWWIYFLGVLAFYCFVISPKTMISSLYAKPEMDFTFSLIWYFFVPFIAGGIVFVVLDAYFKRRDRRKLDERIHSLDGKELTGSEFLLSSSIFMNDDFTGVYVLHNTTKGLYYVGQSVHVWKRLSDHLMGRGNADVYADMKYGDKFTIRAIPLVGSGYKNLNDLERDTIKSYDAYEHGYNKTRGNVS